MGKPRAGGAQCGCQAVFIQPLWLVGCVVSSAHMVFIFTIAFWWWGLALRTEQSSKVLVGGV